MKTIENVDEVTKVNKRGYDIAVFDKRRRFHSVEELNTYFHTLDDGDETKDYSDYRNSTPELQNWFFAMKDIVERFLSYTRIDTTSSEDTDVTPSTPNQFILADQLA